MSRQDKSDPAYPKCTAGHPGPCPSTPHVFLGTSHEFAIHSCAADRLDLVKRAFHEDPNLDVNQPHKGFTMLHVAAQHASAELVKYLVVERKADVHLVDQVGVNALGFACVRDAVEVAKVLVEDGDADFDSVLGRVRHTPLLIAAEMGGVNTMRYLMNEWPVDHHARTRDGYDVIDLATLHHQLPVLRFLMKEMEMDVWLPNRMLGGKPFLFATLTVVSEQKGVGAPLTRRVYTDKDKIEQFKVLKYLVEECKLDINVRTSQGSTLLHHAAMLDNPFAAAYIMRHADCSDQFVFTADTDESATPTAVKMAVREHSLSVVKEMVKHTTGLYDEEHMHAAFWLRYTMLALALNHMDTAKYLVGVLRRSETDPQLHGDPYWDLVFPMIAAGETAMVNNVIQYCMNHMDVTSKLGYVVVFYLRAVVSRRPEIVTLLHNWRCKFDAEQAAAMSEDNKTQNTNTTSTSTSPPVATTLHVTPPCTRRGRRGPVVPLDAKPDPCHMNRRHRRPPGPGKH